MSDNIIARDVKANVPYDVQSGIQELRIAMTLLDLPLVLVQDILKFIVLSTLDDLNRHCKTTYTMWKLVTLREVTGMYSIQASWRH